MIYSKLSLTNSFLILFIVFLFQLNLFGQGEWVLNFKDGTSISVEMSDAFASSDNFVRYKDKESGKKKEIHSSELFNMHYLLNGNTFIYEKKYKLAKNFGKNVKRSSYDLWAAKIYETDKMEVFIFRDFFVSGATASNSTYYTKTGYRVKSENYIIDGGAFGANSDAFGYKAWSKVMCSTLKKAFKYTCPNFSKKITPKSYFIDEYDKIADDFTKTCN